MVLTEFMEFLAEVLNVLTTLLSFVVAGQTHCLSYWEFLHKEKSFLSLNGLSVVTDSQL